MDWDDDPKSGSELKTGALSGEILLLAAENAHEQIAYASAHRFIVTKKLLSG